MRGSTSIPNCSNLTRLGLRWRHGLWRGKPSGPPNPRWPDRTTQVPGARRCRQRTTYQRQLGGALIHKCTTNPTFGHYFGAHQLLHVLRNSLSQRFIPRCKYWVRDHGLSGPLGGAWTAGAAATVTSFLGDRRCGQVGAVGAGRGNKLNVRAHHAVCSGGAVTAVT